ncbi:MAG: helix-turn-helix domain-containing protein [Candidatus Mycalebacterium zealandia]|nr:MAG: helix-turn-helix domain-containing protein [Candidatus Mycalebacterium zealandia]
MTHPLRTVKNSPRCLKRRKKLLELTRREPLHIDKIAEKTGSPVSSVSTFLLELEIEGLIEQTEGGLYQSKV